MLTKKKYILRDVIYPSVEGSAEGGGSLLWSKRHRAPAAPTGQSAALWVCRSGKPQQRRNFFLKKILMQQTA